MMDYAKGKGSTSKEELKSSGMSSFPTQYGCDMKAASGKKGTSSEEMSAMGGFTEMHKDKDVPSGTAGKSSANPGSLVQ